ncbi:MAG: hypothetical protein JWN67_3263 [Actinomycetia bacterium]|nr:hypothetical protein [Actinomycetes bacterium]
MPTPATYEDVPAPLPQLFTPPEEMLAKLRSRVEERGWPLSRDQLDDLAANVPAVPSEWLVDLSFDIWLGDLETTMTELIEWLRDELPGFTLWEAVTFDPDHLRLLDPGRYGHEPSVGWVTIDYAANFTPASSGAWASRDDTDGRPPAEVRDPVTSAGLELVTALALHHAHYIPNLDYQEVPGFWVPGLQVSVAGEEPWQRVPQLALIRGPRFVMLFAGFDVHRDCYYSLPVRTGS